MNKWFEQGNTYAMSPGHDPIDGLPTSIYSIDFSPMSGFFLTRKEDKFKLPSKLYGMEDAFIQRVLRTWDNLEQGVLGVLLQGLKGTGKTITAKQIAERANVPVLLCSNPYGGMFSYLADIKQDIILFIDEFEKVVDQEKENPWVTELLRYLDGVKTPNNRCMTLLTSNSNKIHDALLDRPTRIRYRKEFESVGKDVVEEITNDKVSDKVLAKKILDTLANVNYLTIDNILSFIKEALIHTNIEPEELLDDFNISRKMNILNVYRQKINKYDELLGESRSFVDTVNPREISPNYDWLSTVETGDLAFYGYKLILRGKNVGPIDRKTEDGGIVVKKLKRKKLPVGKTVLAEDSDETEEEKDEKDEKGVDYVYTFDYAQSAWRVY